MADLKSRLQSDLADAMRAHDDDSLRTIRMLLTAISQAESSGKTARSLSGDEEIAILSTELKKRREAATAFSSAGRDELAANEEAEAKVIQRYLPEPLSSDELNAMISDAVAQASEQGLTGGRAMGAVMKQLKGETAGRVDGGQLAASVKSALGM